MRRRFAAALRLMRRRLAAALGHEELPTVVVDRPCVVEFCQPG
jgi:hypothetical protein